MSSRLAMQQTALLDLLHQSTTDLGALCADVATENSLFALKNPAYTLRGLRAYRANAQALAASALQAVYPTMEQLLGSENFEHLAHDLWRAQPPQRGDLAQWGEGLARYLSEVPQLQSLLDWHAYLPDMARVEWALHQAATASDAALNAQSFQMLSSTDPDQLCLTLSPGCQLLRSAFPVVAIWQLHDRREPENHPSAQRAIDHAQPQTAFIWRRSLRPMLATVAAGAAALLELSLQGKSLAAALDAAVLAQPDFDFSAWLSSQVQAGSLLGVAAL